MEILKVLVVDDEPNIRDLLSASLRFAGHQVATAANGTDAINMITETKPDIVLLDVMLPDISGFGVTKKIRGMGIEVQFSSSPRAMTLRTRSRGSLSAEMTM